MSEAIHEVEVQNLVWTFLRDVNFDKRGHTLNAAKYLVHAPQSAKRPLVCPKRLVTWMQTTLLLNLDEALREAALWEVDKPREEWLFGFPAELALLAGQVLINAMLPV